jgi:glutaconate CoA-transferase subunit B
MAEWMTLAEAISAHVHDGDVIALEGFTHLIPFAAGHEIIRQRRRNLSLVRMTPVAVITDLCILRPDPVMRELMVTSIHPGVDRAAIVASTGWSVQFAEDCAQTEPPGARELATLRDLKARTAEAHGVEGEAA